MKPALVLLAAGASRRLGACKALVDLGGRTPLERLLGAGACFDEVAPLVVAGAHVEALQAALPSTARLVQHPAWAAGRTGSVLCAVRALPGRDLCLAPVDVPLVPTRVFEALLAAWQEAQAPPRGWLAPRHGARHGHPVLIGRELLAELEEALAARPGLSLRDLRRGAAPLLELPVTAEEVLDDLDTPADLQRLRARIDPK